MILIGQYDSPFVRRVGIALVLYDLAFEHRPWSSFGDADKLRAYNPLTRVPTLILDDGDVLIDSHIILDYLDGLVPPDKALFPRTEPARHKALKIATLATGLGDKTVSLFYEKALHDVKSQSWITRCRTQISAVLDMLEKECGAREEPYWFGPSLGHTDIAVAAVLRFITEVHPGLVDMALYPALRAHATRCEALPVFQQTQQAFIAPT